MDAHKGANGLWVAGPSWDATRGEFGYARKVRCVFFGQGGPVAICKRYRAYSKQVGLFKPFTEKVKANPNIDLLIGAANIWSHSAGTNKVRLVREMQAAGMRRILWSGGGGADELAAMNAMPDVLTGRYDIYPHARPPRSAERLRERRSRHRELRRDAVRDGGRRGRRTVRPADCRTVKPVNRRSA